MSDKRSSANSLEKRKLITPKFRVSYPSVFQMSAYDDDGKPEYSVTAIFPKKSTDLSAMRKAARAAAKEKWGDEEDWPKKLRWPWRDGDEDKPDNPEYQDSWFMRFTAKKRKPGIVDRNRDEILDEDDFYAGCYARAQVVAYAYDNKGNKGVSFDLWNVQKLAEGEPLGATRDAGSAFDDWDEDSEDDRPKKKSKRDEDDDDDRARKKSRHEDEDDDDDRPRKKSKRLEDDDDDRPKKKRRLDPDEYDFG